MEDRARHQLTQRRLWDRARVLVIIGTLLLMPPLGSVALFDANVGSIPAVVIFVFVTWLGLIIGAAILARPLQTSDEARRQPDEHSSARDA